MTVGNDIIPVLRLEANLKQASYLLQSCHSSSFKHIILWRITNKEARRQQLKTNTQLDMILILKYSCIKCKWMMPKLDLHALSSGLVLFLYFMCMCSSCFCAVQVSQHSHVCNKTWKYLSRETELISEVLEIACPCF